jgi:hypothetical protein
MVPGVSLRHAARASLQVNIVVGERALAEAFYFGALG